MIGCMVLGGLTALLVAKLCRWRWHGHGGWGCGGGFRHHHGGHGCGAYHDDGCGGPGFGRHDDGGFPHERGGWHGGGRNMPFMLRFLSDRLDATPGQERALRDAFEAFRTELRDLRGEGDKTRADLVAALRRPAFDEVLLGELFARHDGAMDRARKAFMSLLAKVHETLDERQRERLAALLEREPRFARGFGW